MNADSTQVTKETIYHDVKSAISEMAAALKVTADHVYEVLVKQQLVNSITWIMIYIGFTIAVFICWKIFQKISKDDRTEGETLAATVVVGLVLFAVGGLTFLATIDNVVTGFVNPEYGAIEKIIELVKK